MDPGRRLVHQDDVAALDSGAIVEIKGPRPSFGTLLELDGDDATVESMPEVGRFQRHTIHRTALGLRTLSREARVYLQNDDGSWQPWRVGRRDGRSYEVVRPERALFVEESRLRVLASDQPSSPVQILACRSQETPFFSERRWRLVREIVRLRGLAGGLDGLLSSAIELLPHQIAAVHRVLTDPVPRYLLADEVGMGKTIEAGVIIRQYLLDSRHTQDRGKVLVCVPTHLARQWRGELRDRFGVAEFENRVVLVSPEAILRWGGDDIGMLVVDEAHRVGRMAWSNEETACYDRLAEIARRAPRVLLLSATPASHHERAYLAMLHLLDPAQYGLEDEASFRARLEAREAIADSMALLAEGTPALEVEFGLDALESDLNLPDEGRRLVTEARRACTEGRNDSLASALRSLRVWLAERYRLHRRVMRSRRTSHEAHMPAAREPARDVESLLLGSLEYAMDSRIEAMVGLIESWRARAAAAAEEGESSAVAARLARVHGALLDAVAMGPEHVAQAARVRLTKAADPRAARVLGEDIVDSLLSCDPFESEEEELEELARVAQAESEWSSEMLASEAACEQVRQALRKDEHPRVVVFTSSTESAREICRLVEIALDEGVCGLHSADLDASGYEEVVARFRDDAECLVLVCDRSGEEGVNLQFARRVVMHDLPLDPGRIEQRLGRLDRFGQQDSLCVRLLAGSPLHEAWAKMLVCGFRVLSTSIAACQYAVEREMQSFLLSLLMNGEEAVTDVSIEAMQEAMMLERRAVAAQDLFDAHELNSEEQRMAAALSHDDYRGDGFAASALDWFHGVLRLRPRRLDDQHVFAYDGPNAIGRALVPNDHLPELGRASAGLLTFSRSRAAARPEIGLLRPGHPLLNLIVDMFWRDERGKASVLWRQWQPGEDHDPEPFPVLVFRFVRTAEAAGHAPDTSRLQESGALRSAVSRLAMRVAPPSTHEVVVHWDGTLVEDELVQATVLAPYKRRRDGGLDTNLDGELNAVLLDVVQSRTFPEDLARSSELAASHLLESEDTRQWKERARVALRAEWQRRHAILEARRSVASEREEALEIESIDRDIAYEDLLHARVRDAVEDARLELDSASVVVLAAGPCPKPEAEG